jgi:hypothetical protein
MSGGVESGGEAAFYLLSKTEIFGFLISSLARTCLLPGNEFMTIKLCFY